MSNIIRIVTSGPDAKKGLLNGVNTVCNVVSDTLGARGNNNIFESLSGLPIITKDGFKSLEEMFLDDPIEALACQIVKEACKKQLDNVGDNTSLVCVLTQSFFKNSIDELNNGKSSIDIKRDIEKSLEKILAYLDSIAVISVTDELMYDIAKTSANGDEEIAKFVQEAYLKAGEFGIVSHKRSFTDETFIEHIAGNPIESGYAHEGFINVQDTQSVVFDNPLVLLSLVNFLTVNEVLPFLDYSSKVNRPLVIVSNMEHDISNVILSNVQSPQNFPFAIIKPPFLGKKQRETMSDLGLVLGSEVLSGITRTNYEGKEGVYLGTCERIEISKKDTVITPCKSVDKAPSIGRIAELNAQIKLLDNENEKNYLRERISKISGGISTIMVGGITPSEVDEKVDRVDDAVCAVRAAKEEGVVAGGGMALLSAYNSLDLDSVTMFSIKAPFLKLMSNASMEPDEKLPEYPMGYDVREFKQVNMFESGILDTVKGIKSALENAVSASNNLIRTNNVITLKRQDNGK